MLMLEKRHKHSSLNRRRALFWDFHTVGTALAIILKYIPI